MELSMKFPEGTKGATGGLYKILPTRRVLTTGNPFWKVVTSLGFRVDKQKNFPLIYAYDENIVRESLIAGLIDSDGYVDKRPYFYASITAIHVPLKDGIVAVCRSLGLNMSASFTPEHITETGFHVQDTFNCIITPGFNFEVFKSLLSRCGCVRKATAKGALLATLSIDEFAPRISSDLRKPLYSFDCSEAEAGECYEIEFENEGTLITENHITLCTQKDSSRVCCSYKNEADVWSPVPWENELTYHSKVKKLCEVCYTNLRLSRTMCSNEECRAILPKTGRELLLKAAKVEKTRDDGTTVVGFPCVKCDGMMLIDDSREDLYNQHRKPGFCNSCKATHSMSWYNDNVYKGKSICHNCNTYQYYTQARCQNEACSLIHHSKHLTEIKLNYRRETGKNAGIEAVLKCIKCQGPVAIDKTKTIRDRKVPYKPGACLTCDRKSERKWKRIPWDKVSSQRMCGKCEVRYKNTATRCLNTSCLHIHTVKEIAKMEKKGEIKAYLPDGSAVSGHPCVSRGCATYKDKNFKVIVRNRGETGEMCLSCKKPVLRCSRPVTWDRQNPQRICGPCASRFREYKARCISSACCFVPCKEELDKMRGKGPLELLGVLPEKKVYHIPCPKCRGKVEWSEKLTGN